MYLCCIFFVRNINYYSYICTIIEFNCTPWLISSILIFCSYWFVLFSDCILVFQFFYLIKDFIIYLRNINNKILYLCNNWVQVYSTTYFRYFNFHDVLIYLHSICIHMYYVFFKYHTLNRLFLCMIFCVFDINSIQYH